MPLASTTVLQPSAAPGRTLRGRVSLVADITGKAPVGGAVARWKVEPGARVQTGQAVVQISSGAASAPPLPGESKVIAAEKQQTAAADDQVALSQRLTDTQTRLAAAQQRVERAQTKVADARELIARLRVGDGGAALPAPVAPKIKANKTRATPQLASARAKSRAAQSELESTKSQLARARADLSAAQKSLAPLQAKVSDAQKSATTIEGKFDGGEGSMADIQVARNTLAEAKSTLDSATKRVETLLGQVPPLEKQLVVKSSAAESARQIEAALAAKTPGDTEAPATSPQAPAISLDDAAKQVSAAVAESRAAAKEADRLRALVTQYQGQATNTNERVATATQTLQNVPVVSTAPVPRVRFTEATAPASGIVVWIATLAREVGAGQSVFGLSSGHRFIARFEDRSDSWKDARVGQTVSALLAPPAPALQAATSGAAPADAPPSSATATTATNATPMAERPAPITAANSTEVSVRLTRIAPPERAGQPAILEGEIAPGAGATAGPNWRLLASLPDPKAPAVLAVPNSALVERGNAVWVATIEAAPAVTATPTGTPSAATGEIAAGQLQWQKVEVSAQPGALREIKSGLRAGQRIVTDPLPLLADVPPESKVLPQVKLSAL